MNCNSFEDFKEVSKKKKIKIDFMNKKKWIDVFKKCKECY